MDCGHARLLLLFYRPGRTSELTPEDTAALECHLHACAECSAHFQREASIQHAVGTAIRKVPVPANLHKNLIKAGTAVVNARWRQRVIQRSLAAAVMLVAGLLVWGGYLRATREVLDPEAIAFRVDQILDSRENVAQVWLNRLSLQLPEPLDLRMVQSVGDMRLQNRTVPGMLFLQPTTNQIAWVYFLPPGHFDLSLASNAQASNATARVYKNLPGGWAALIVYTGNDLRPFIRITPEQT